MFISWNEHLPLKLNILLSGTGNSWATRTESAKLSDLQPLDGQPQHAGGQLGRLFEGEVAPVDDEDEAVDLQLGIFYHRFQWQ